MNLILIGRLMLKLSQNLSLKVLRMMMKMQNQK